jgi:hypothetical protein
METLKQIKTPAERDAVNRRLAKAFREARRESEAAVHSVEDDKRTFLDYSHGRKEYGPDSFQENTGIVYRLWTCTDVLPREECRRQGLPIGSTWGDAMRAFLAGALDEIGMELVYYGPDGQRVGKAA